MTNIFCTSIIGPRLDEVRSDIGSERELHFTDNRRGDVEARHYDRAEGNPRPRQWERLRGVQTLRRDRESSWKRERGLKTLGNKAKTPRFNQ